MLRVQPKKQEMNFTFYFLNSVLGSLRLPGSAAGGPPLNCLDRLPRQHTHLLGPRPALRCEMGEFFFFFFFFGCTCNMRKFSG